MNKYVTVALPATLLAASVAFAAPSATTQPSHPTTTTQATPAAQYSDATLIKFAQATQAARKVRKDYKQKIKATSDQQTKEQLKKQGKQAMGAAITKYMPVSEYEQILRQVRHDPQLKARIKKLVKERTSKAASSGTTH